MKDEKGVIYTRHMQSTARGWNVLAHEPVVILLKNKVPGFNILWF